MALIGRKQERRDFLEWMNSDEAELICVYGRRRIGKTFFVTDLLGDFFAFDASGLAQGGMSSQLKAFHEALLDYGDTSPKAPEDWWEAFRRLKALLELPECRRTPEGKRVVFLDELPWFDTPRSDFLNAFSDFWNRWAQRRSDVKVVICGSATSWILSEVLQTEGGLNRRVTHSLHLEPFTLKETEEFLKVERGIEWDRRQVVEAYMVFGGTPFYLRKLQARLSLAQNITTLCLGSQAPLKDEAKRLLDSTLSDKPLYYKVLSCLGARKAGLARGELVESLGVKDGKGFTAVLLGLEECGFIRRYENPYRKGRKSLYQLVDPFLLFSMRFIGTEAPLRDWSSYFGTPSYNAWRGNAFETVCICHMRQVKLALGLSAMDTREFPWSGESDQGSAQIDLVIERPDRVTYACEMKCTDEEFSISAAYRQELLRKNAIYKEATGTGSVVQTVVIASAGFKENGNSDIVRDYLTADDLFSI